VLRLTSFLDQRVDGRAIGVARIVLGVAAFLKGVVTLAHLINFQQSDALAFPYTSLELSFTSGPAANVVVALWLIAALLFTAGMATRVAGAVLTASIFLVIAIDQQMYSNHLYLLGTMTGLMTIAGPSARFSLDARWGRAAPTVPRWAVTLIKLQLTSVYLFAAITKLNEAFLSGSVIASAFDPAMRMRVERYVDLELLAWAAIATELALAFAFWSARGREFALPVGIAFHAMNVVMMNRGGMINLSIFALIMVSIMIVFFTEEPAGEQSPEAEEPEPARPATVAIESTAPAER
jgi:hypothetical protein